MERRDHTRAKSQTERDYRMKTMQQQETEAILSMVELIKTLEQQLADAKARIEELENNQPSNFANLKSHYE